ncbi:MAG TPA: hypothetical protein VFZ53_27400 [Polyangiaceae bacterium]
MLFRAGSGNWATRRRSAAVLMALALFAPHCQTLYGVDTPRRSLQEHDDFSVEPQCPDLVIDSSSLAATLRVVTLTGRRQKTGLGAESVPVSVNIGQCELSPAHPGSSDADAADASDAGSETAEGGAGGASGGPPSNPPGSRCHTALEPLVEGDQARFALVAQEGRGCRARSSSRLECTLDANGEAAFGIVSQSLASVLSLNGYLPICVTPLELDLDNEGDDEPHHQIEMAVTPRFGESRIAVAVAELGGPESVPPIESADGCVLRRCDTLKPRASFQAGVVSPDIPAEAIRASDFLEVSRDATFNLSLRSHSPAPEGTAFFLTTDESCRTSTDAGGAGETDGGTEPSISLKIASGQSSTAVFFLCAPAFASSHDVVATLAEATANQPLLRTHRIGLPSLLERYVVESVSGQRHLLTETCNDERAQATNVRVREPWFVVGDGQDMLLECRTDGGTVDGAAGAAGAPPSPDDPSECANVTLELGSPQGTCTVPAN